MFCWSPGDYPQRGVLSCPGGGGPKGTTNWPETAHSAIWPRAKNGKIGVPRSLPPFFPEVGLWVGSIQMKGHVFFIHYYLLIDREA